jgi:hypothetical protein
MTQVHVLENELTIQRREAQELRADLEASRIEKSSVQRILECTLEEKKQMINKINTLTAMGMYIKYIKVYSACLIIILHERCRSKFK